MNSLKLFVMGERSPDPGKWSGVGARAIVIARDEKEAEAMSELRPAVEIPLDKSMVLITEQLFSDL